jgi:hypothetical protein
MATDFAPGAAANQAFQKHQAPGFPEARSYTARDVHPAALPSRFYIVAASQTVKQRSWALD